MDNKKLIENLYNNLPEYSGRLFNTLAKHSNCETTDSFIQTLNNLHNPKSAAELASQTVKMYYETGNPEYLLDAGLLILAIETAHVVRNKTCSNTIKVENDLSPDIFREAMMQ